MFQCQLNNHAFDINEAVDAGSSFHMLCCDPRSSKKQGGGSNCNRVLQPYLKRLTEQERQILDLDYDVEDVGGRNVEDGAASLSAYEHYSRLEELYQREHASLAKEKTNEAALVATASLDNSLTTENSAWKSDIFYGIISFLGVLLVLAILFIAYYHRKNKKLRKAIGERSYR